VRHGAGAGQRAGGWGGRPLGRARPGGGQPPPAVLGVAGGRRPPASDLSHGEVRELEVLLALALKPKVLLLDEPAAGLSPAERVDIQALLTSLPAELTLIMIEHDIDVLRGVVDSVAVLHLGSLVVQGS